MAASRAAALMPVACLLGAVAVALVAKASAQSGGCTTTLISLYPCLNYISGNVSTPPASCCSSLSSVVQSNPQCLCTALSGDSSALGGITIDKNRALQLPKACNVQTPPESRCNSAGGGGGGGGGGGSTPGAATPTTPTTPSGASTGGAETGSGSKTTPTSPYLTSGGASLHGAASLVLAFAAVALYTISAV